MAQRKRLVRFALAVVFFVALVGGLVAYAWADCNTYDDSHPVYDPEYGTYCGGSGGTCTECYNPNGGGDCVTNGSFCEEFRD